MLARGPWQFEKALICLAEPVGIGEVTKHVFTRVILGSNSRCTCFMHGYGDNMELGEAIGSVEEVATYVIGACFGKYIRLCISVDITNPLIKVLSLKQDDENEIARRVDENEIVRRE